jgi:hypothetical protein
METINRIIDQAWASVLDRAMKKRDILRPGIGDDIDLYVPQSRLLALAESNPTIPRLLYLSAQSSAQRNAYIIARKLGMPADYFWKFEYWPKDRAFTTLEKIVGRIFSAIMSQAREGNMKIIDLTIEPLRISVTFKDCVECAGITGLKHPVCYYHAGVFAGIISALINRELDCFETACYACGDQSCDFIIGDKTDDYIKTGFEQYCSPPQVNADLLLRLEKSLSNLPVRTIGNLVDVNYLQLVVATTLLANPQLFASANFEVGSQLGQKLASVLVKFYGQPGLKNMSDYYLGLGQLSIEIKEAKPQLELSVRECAESVGHIKRMDMVSFLLGELQGLVSKLTETDMVITDSRFEDDTLILILVPKVRYI